MPVSIEGRDGTNPDKDDLVMYDASSSVYETVIKFARVKTMFETEALLEADSRIVKYYTTRRLEDITVVLKAKK